ncbi:hypothetical protein [Haloferula sp. BvORR071]|uniref:hypothetical protein n=1 Tax=Haloferula sp. BvORR071 TaxID=1396141 RepID=UPI000557A70D|nr:hypothetical protein [Haloferula sp. BvORR071]
MKKDTLIPAREILAAHEQAAAEVTQLRRKGIHCHIEEHAAPGGHCLDVVVDREGPVEAVPPPPPQVRTKRRRF